MFVSASQFRGVAAVQPVGGTLVAAVSPVRPVRQRSSAGQSERPFGVVSEATITSISQEARDVFAQHSAGAQDSQRAMEETAFPRSEAGSEISEGEEAQETTSHPTELDESEEDQVRELKSRDTEVRAHEQAHKAVGGQYAGSIHYDFERGPDGRNYATGGHVDIDVSPIPGDPGATVAKMQQVVRAALAPAEPSGADRAVAAEAMGKAAEARREQSSQGSQESSAESTEPDAPSARGANALNAFAHLLEQSRAA